MLLTRGNKMRHILLQKSSSDYHAYKHCQTSQISMIKPLDMKKMLCLIADL